MKKLMIFGGSGFVGGNIAAKALAQGWSVIIADSQYRPGIDQAQWITVDITEASAVNACIKDALPDAVVNVAAIADIDKAEKDKDLARKVNVDGARNIATACAQQGCRYIFFSSDAVFSGNESAYHEEDPINPVNYYGRTKADAEQAISAAHPQSAIIRISLVIGFPVTGGNSFFAGLESKLKEGKQIPCPASEVRTPIDVHTLSECILELAQNDFQGILHVGGIESISRFDLTKKAAMAMGYPVNQIIKQDDAVLASGRAPRHKNGIIDVSKAKKLFKTKLLTVDEGIARAIRDRPQKVDS
jgi:dTDP-4-dehydrorhamnose reductase